LLMELEIGQSKQKKNTLDYKEVKKNPRLKNLGF